MRELSRRTLLIATTTLTLVPPGRAAATPGPAPAGVGSHSPLAAGSPLSLSSGNLGNLQVSVYARATQDVLAMLLTFVNTGGDAATVTASYTDLFTGRQSRLHTVEVPAGATQTLELYGALTHEFVIDVCQTDGTCIELGPVGPPTGP
jgi:hypothetical protein